MLKIRTRRLATASIRAVDRLEAIEASVGALTDEDLLDLADIFATGEPTPMREIAQAEVRRRNLTP